MEDIIKLNVSSETVIKLEKALNNTYGVVLHIEQSGGTPATSVLIAGKLRTVCGKYKVYGNFPLAADDALQYRIELPIAELRVTPVGGTCNIVVVGGA